MSHSESGVVAASLCGGNSRRLPWPLMMQAGVVTSVLAWAPSVPACGPVVLR